MAQLITVRLNKSEQQPLGFRLQGGKDFGTPLVVQKVNGGSAAERAGLQAGDALIRVNTTDVYTLRHQEAQDAIRAAGQALELTVQRGGGTWRPSVTPTGSLPRPGTRPLGASPVPVTNTSLKATPQPTRAFGSGHNSVAKPFGYMNGNDSSKGIVNKQYNSPVSMYSDKTIAETLSAQTEVLAGGVLGVNFKKNEKTYDSEKSAVFKVLQEEQNDPEPVAEVPASAPVSGLRPVAPPAPRPEPVNNTGGLPPGQNICEECERLITGVFVRIKDKNMHVECFKCSTCGSSLKNQGYYNINGKLYCDIHAKLVARQHPPAANLEPVTVPPGGRIPTNAYSTPLPPLATNSYTNGSSSMFSPSSTLSGPKPFGSSVGSAYSPASLSPRSAPLSPARAAPAPAPAPVPAPFGPTKNVKSIVWPPPNHPDDEIETEINPNFIHNIPYSDSSALARESLMMTTNSNINFSNKMESVEEHVSASAKQTTGCSSNSTFGSTLMSTSNQQATSKSEFSVQSQKSQMIQEVASCSVQSFSEHATSENQNFALYQTHMASDQIDGNKQITKKDIEKLIDSQEQFIPSQSEFNSSNVTENFSQKFAMKKEISEGCDIKSLNVKQDNKTVETKTQQQTSVMNNYNNPSVFMSTESENKDSRAKTYNVYQTQNPPFLKKCNPDNNRENPSTSHSHNPPYPNVQFKSSSKEKPKVGNPTATKKPAIERGSLIEALTIAPDRPFSPLSFNIPNPNYASTSFDQNQTDLNKELVHSIPTQNTNYSTYNQSDPNQFGHPNMQTNMLKTSSESSAFRPVSKEQPQPQEYYGVSNYPPANKETTDFVSHQQSNLKESNITEKVVVSSSISTSNQGFEPITTAQCYSPQSNTHNTFSPSSPVPLNAGLHRPDSIPPYQQNLESSQPQGALTSNTNKPLPRNAGTGQQNMPLQYSEIPQSTTPVQQDQTKMKNETSMSFQTVFDETQNMSRYTPTNSRPTTPSLINKPAPIIPHYQMNLVTVEHDAPESRMYKPCSEEVSRSSTPKLSSRSPAPTLPLPSNSSKAQAPRIKDASQKYNIKQSQTSSPQVSPFKKEYESDFQDNNVKKWLQDQPALVKEEQQSNLEYRTESYNRGSSNIKEDSMLNQSYGQRQMESQNTLEYGSTTVESTRKTFEQFESAQSAKTIEIRQGAVQPSNTYQQTKPIIQPSNYNFNQVFPPPSKETISSQQNLSFNTTNENIATTSNQTEVYQPTPFISGANQGPVCDPTPSTGSSVGAAARGKAFGVSSAPKRGRGVLNKAALPGSRVPLCGSCNGNIRGPFITALGRIWCPEHFICVNATCRRQLQDIGFVEENGQLYCEYCFEQYIAPACDKCHAKIKGDCLNAIGKHFHPECFSCVYCHKLFGNNPFFLEDGLPYCEADWNELFTTKCFACGFPVEAGDRWVEALSNNYHSQCFNCTVCKKNLEGQSFFAKGGRPFCKMHAR